MGTEAVHRARYRALLRCAQGEISGEPIVPNDVGFENFDWRSVHAVRDELERLGIGYGVQPTGWAVGTCPGDPIARGVGTPVSHATPA